ncbi:MAG: hypothetical protein Q9168_007643 [Polycauliona sp. 1 TL-2023]
MSEGIREMETALRGSLAREMKQLRLAAESTLSTWAIVSLLYLYWHQHVEHVVPRPYLDEFFHVQQAELYLQARFSEWHPKITTPPGLYLVSLLYLGFLSLIGLITQVNVIHLRETVAFAAILFPFICRRVLRGVITEYDGIRLSRRNLSTMWSFADLNHAVLNICLFPPLFFFYALYYTDVWSALSVLITIHQYHRRAAKSLVAAGIASLFFRQTNIFWITVYLGGLELTRRLRRGRVGMDYALSPTWSTVAFGSWQYSCIYNPLVVDASFEDYVKTALSIIIATVACSGSLLPHLKPYLILLGAFGYFVLWNEGVVLGDKENHIPSLHLAQMLYIWPYILFFSFPLVYPYFLSAIIPQKYIPSPLRTGSTRHQLPRLIVTIPIMATMLAVVHFNTIVHPFTLADNRHYTFYVFRLLLRHPANKYLAVPIYFYSAWAAITAFGGLPNVQLPRKKKSSGHLGKSKSSGHFGRSKPKPPMEPVSSRHVPRASDPLPEDRGNHVGTVLIWLAASSLSLVTAPLVEPRYFIIPWIVWRLHVVGPWPTGRDAYRELRKRITTFSVWYKAVLYAQHDHRLWLETIWFAAVNWGVCYVFLNWGFEWPQEKGKVQRFMW